MSEEQSYRQRELSFLRNGVLEFTLHFQQVVIPPSHYKQFEMLLITHFQFVGADVASEHVP